MLLTEIKKMARTNCAKVAIGVGDEYIKKTVTDAIKSEKAGYADVVLVGSSAFDVNLKQVITENPEKELVRLVSKGEVDAVVRGTLKATKMLKEIKRELRLKKVFRVALLVTAKGKPFFFAPVGVDEGSSIRDRIKLGVLGGELMEKLGLEPKIGVLSGGRLEDIGRNPEVDKSIAAAEAITQKLRERGFEAEHSEILVERAIKECNYIMAPDGITGNLMFRSLVFLGGGEGIGAPFVGIDKVIVDKSREGRGYDNTICLASALAGR